MKTINHKKVGFKTHMIICLLGLGLVVTVTSSILNVTIENDAAGHTSLLATIVKNRTDDIPSPIADFALGLSAENPDAKNLSTDSSPQTTLNASATLDDTNCTMAKKRQVGHNCYQKCYETGTCTVPTPPSQDIFASSPLCRTPFFFPLCCLQSAIRRRHALEDPSSAPANNEFPPCLNGVCCNSTQVVVQEKGGHRISTRVIKDIKFVGDGEHVSLHHSHPVDDGITMKRDINGYYTDDCMHYRQDNVWSDCSPEPNTQVPCPDGTPGRTLYFRLVDNEVVNAGYDPNQVLGAVRHWKREGRYPEAEDEDDNDNSWTGSRRLDVRNFHLIDTNEEEDGNSDDDDDDDDENGGIPVLYGDYRDDFNYGRKRMNQPDKREDLIGSGGEDEEEEEEKEEDAEGEGDEKKAEEEDDEGGDEKEEQKKEEEGGKATTAGSSKKNSKKSGKENKGTTKSPKGKSTKAPASKSPKSGGKGSTTPSSDDEDDSSSSGSSSSSSSSGGSSSSSSDSDSSTTDSSGGTSEGGGQYGGDQTLSPEENVDSEEQEHTIQTYNPKLMISKKRKNGGKNSQNDEDEESGENEPANRKPDED